MINCVWIVLKIWNIVWSHIIRNIQLLAQSRLENTDTKMEETKTNLKMNVSFIK